MKETTKIIQNLNKYITKNNIKQTWIAEMLSMDKML